MPVILDLWLARKVWKNAFTNVQRRRDPLMSNPHDAARLFSARAIANGLLVIATALTSACATYGDQQEAAWEAMRSGAYEEAEQLLDANLRSDDLRLLRAMELGMLHHQAGRYELSNQFLEQADRLRDTLSPVAGSVDVESLLVNPASGPYRGASHEYAYVNYFKALNFLMLAQETGDPRWLDAARVEARRLDIILDEFAATVGDYPDLASASDDEGALRSVANALRGNEISAENLQFRDDAWARFLAGVTYERNQEWDNARISYRSAAEAYDAGYAEQYQLGPQAAKLAWAGVVRMMRAAGGWESTWPAIVAEQALDERLIEPLSPGEGLLLLVEHVDRVAPVGELNMILYGRPRIQSIEIQPLPAGSEEDADDQLLWFHLHYSDRGIADLASRYMAGGVWEVVNQPLTSQQIFLGPLWDVADQTGLLSGIGPIGLRIAVPWYPPLATEPAARVADVAGAPTELVPVAHPEAIKRQELLLGAQGELYRSIVRELIRNTAVAAGREVADQLTDSSQLGILLELSGRITSAAWSRAETRYWSTLPRLTRAQVVRTRSGPVSVPASTTGESSHSTIDVRDQSITVHVYRQFSEPPTQQANE